MDIPPASRGMEAGGDLPNAMFTIPEGEYHFALEETPGRVVNAISPPIWRARLFCLHPLQYARLISSLLRIPVGLISIVLQKRRPLRIIESPWILWVSHTSAKMKSWNGLALALLTLWSNNATLTFAQYVVTVTEYVNDNPFCTPVSSIGVSGGSAGVSSTGSASGSGAPGANGGGAGNPGSGPASGSLNGSSNGTSSATNGRQVHLFFGQDRLESVILMKYIVF